MISVSSATLAKISKDELVPMKVIDDNCRDLDCEVQDVIVHVKEPTKEIVGLIYLFCYLN